MNPDCLDDVQGLNRNVYPRLKLLHWLLLDQHGLLELLGLLQQNLLQVEFLDIPGWSLLALLLLLQYLSVKLGLSLGYNRATAEIMGDRGRTAVITAWVIVGELGVLIKALMCAGRLDVRWAP